MEWSTSKQSNNHSIVSSENDYNPNRYNQNNILYASHVSNTEQK